MKNLATMETAERRNALKAIRANRTTLVEIYQVNTKPTETVKALVDAIGYDAAVETIAELVNSVSSWDGRISRANREWAAGIDTAATPEELAERSIYAPSEIHPAHIDQIANAMQQYQPGTDEGEPEEIKKTAPTMKTIEEVRKALKARRDRSAWDKGVTAYALELLDSLKGYRAYNEADTLLHPLDDLKTEMLNGAMNWSEYSWSGSSLIYDCEIAERLCTPSELKKNRNGERNPNNREQWLDTQARALRQAYNLIRWEVRK